MSDKISITACLMVKDEEKFIKQCLNSIKDIVDSIVICDTGSTDRTLDIIKKFDNVKLYHTPWRNDFSSHRNETLSYATGDWCLVIDADEKLIPSKGFNINKLKKWLEMVQDKYNVVAIPIRDMQQGQTVMSCNSARLFKKGKVEYKHRIHNSPIFEGAAVLCDMLEIEHYGYDLSEEKMKQKFLRTYNLLMKEMEDVDEEGNPKRKDVYFYLAQLLGHHGRNEESREYAKKYIGLKEKIESSKFNRTIFFTHAKSCQEAGLVEESYKTIMDGLAGTPYDPDLTYALSDYGAMTNNHEIMLEGSKRFIKGYRMMTENPALRCGQFYFTLRPDSLLLMLYRYMVGSLSESAKVWQVLKPQLKGAPSDILDELKTNLVGLGQKQMLDEISYLYNDNKVENNFKFDVFKVAI